MRNHRYLLFALIFFIVGINYSFIDSLLISAFEEECLTGIVERVIDGDTVVLRTTSGVEGSGSSEKAEEFKVRLLGINSPEKGEIGYDEAKEFLVREIEGREIRLKFGREKVDRYKRKLAYVFLGNRNMNLESVREGFSSFYFPSGKDNYYSLFHYAWENCLIDEIGICLRSGDECIKLDWNPLDDLVELRNACSYAVDISGWSVKDEGRKKFIFDEKVLEGGEIVSLSSVDWGKDYVWTRNGDSIFVRDSLNGLVVWETY